MGGVSRFECPSAKLNPGWLLRRTRHALGAAVAAALALHVSLTAVGRGEAQERAAKPLTTQFVKRAPRLTKPLELKKRPRPKRRLLQRQMVSVRARTQPQQGVGLVLPAQTLGSLARPSASIGRMATHKGIAFEPRSLAQAVQGTMEAKEKIDMGLELLDIEALDTGEYQAMVVQDPNDKRNIKGFFHMARLRSPVIDFIATPSSLSWTEWMRTNSMFRIAEAVNRYTSIRADYRDTFTPDDRELLEVPMVFLLPVSAFKVTDSESANLGAYMTSGGFLVGDWASMRIIESLYQVVERALTAVGMSRGEWDFAVLPDNHALYHCFFDFDGAPPGSVEYFQRAYPADECAMDNPNPAIKGVDLDGHLAAVISEKWYAYVWGTFGLKPSTRWTTRPYETLDPSRQLQFAVNLVVYALTQEGSITKRLMESVSY